MANRKPPMAKQTPNDRVSTITHLASTIQENSRHALVHAKEAVRQAKRLKDPASVTIEHNAQHSLTHVIEMAAHADKLIKHLKKFPGGDATLRELNASPPSKIPAPPGKKAKDV
jgi:hypothetical protein